MTAPAGPALRDPVVVDGVKYRIRAIDTDPPPIAHLRTTFGEQGRLQVRLDELLWDRVAGVWRVVS